MHSNRRPTARNTVLSGAAARSRGRIGDASATGRARASPPPTTSSSVSAGDYNTSLSNLMLFLYGIVGGALSCLFFFFFVFYKVRSKLEHTIRKKAVKHQAFEEVAKAAAVVPPAKVETLCKVVCFDDDVVGEVIQCRALLFSDTMVLYKVEQLSTHHDHRQVVVKETLLGKINRNCAVVSGERISKYHRHLNLLSRYSPVKGKVTILRSKDPDMPLFMQDPAAQLQERLDELRRAREESRKHGHRSSSNSSSYRSAASSSAPGASQSASTTWTQKMEEQLDALTMLTKAGRACRESGDADAIQAHRQTIRNQLQKLLVPRGRRFGGVDPFARGVDDTNDEDTPPSSLEAPVRQWGSIAIKFPNRRVNERWFNLLQGTTQTLQWQYYLNHLPHMDVLNLILARLFFENSSADGLHDLFRDKLQKNLSNVSNNFGDNLKGDIRIDGLTVGGEVPLITNVSDCSVDQTGELDFDFDVLYRGGLMMTIRLANFSYRDIHVPDLLFHIKVLELSGRLHFNIGPPPTQKFWLGCRRVPDLRLEFTQEVASHEGILNVVLNILPDMSSPMSNVVKTLLFDDMVYPSFDDFPWPVIDGPEKKKKARAEKEQAAHASQPGLTTKKQKRSTATTNTSSATPKEGGGDGATPRSAADNASLASTVLSTPQRTRRLAGNPLTEDLSPPPRPLTSAHGPPPRVPPLRMTPSALPASSISSTPTPAARPVRVVGGGRDPRALDEDSDDGLMTPVLLSARNLDDDQGDAKESASASSVRRRRVGTVIRVSAPQPQTPLPASSSSRGRPSLLSRSGSSSSFMASARAEAARTFDISSPLEYVSSGHSTVAPTGQTPRRPSLTPRSTTGARSERSQTSSLSGRTRITVSARSPRQPPQNRTETDPNAPIVFSGGSSASVTSSARASRAAKKV